jgi:hypothetical protein
MQQLLVLWVAQLKLISAAVLPLHFPCQLGQPLALQSLLFVVL